MKSKEFKLLDGVVIGRSDLAGSLSLSKKDVNKKIIFMKVFNAFKKIKSKKKNDIQDGRVGNTIIKRFYK